MVQKFGGSSVADADRVRNVAERIIESYKNGNEMVIVLSAQGDTTDDLLAKAKEINRKASKRELDMLLSTGEQQSIALMAMAIHAKGFPAVSLNAIQAGILSSSTHSNARIRRINCDRIQQEIDKNNIVIVSGFQGYNRYGEITTLGRGASDTTAVALAAALQADICEIYTDVDGIYTADPRICKNARKIDAISYDEMLELASLGARVLHNRSVELAKKYKVNLVVRSSFSKAEGTVVKEENKLEKMFVSGLAIDKDVARISIISVQDQPGKAYEIFSLLAKNKISVDIILQSIGREKTKDISFTVARSDLNEALDLIKTNEARISYKALSCDDKIAKLSIVGAGMATNPGVAAIMFEALYDARINIHMISTSEIKISVLIDESDAERAANAVHDRFLVENIDLPI